VTHRGQPCLDLHHFPRFYLKNLQNLLKKPDLALIFLKSGFALIPSKGWHAIFVSSRQGKTTPLKTLKK
jgi:predicted RNA binding protein YcfA (HicA-like mRNA interferase family)